MITSEQIFLSGAPTVGFGSDDRAELEKNFYAHAVLLPLGGLVVGTIGGAVLGSKIKHPWIGGILGTFGGTSLGMLYFTWWLHSEQQKQSAQNARDARKEAGEPPIW